MIAKITHGRSASRALAYDHGPGRADEHRNPHRVAGNIAGRDWRVRAHTMQRFISAHQNSRQDRQQNVKGRDGQNQNRPGRQGGQGRGERGVYRIALANPNTDRVLSDQEWRQIADKFVERFSGRDGAQMGPWEATRHDAHHIHLTISKYGYDGHRMSESHDYRRVAQICRDLEREHGLTNAAGRSGRGSGRVRADKEHAARTAGRGEPPKDRDWLRQTVSGVLRDGGGIDELRAAGVEVKLNQASTGRVSGISYARIPEEARAPNEQQGQDRHGHHGVHRDGDTQIWFKGSQLGKAYSWNQVRQHLEHEQRAPETEDQHHAQPPRADERTVSDRAPDREESGRATDARGGPAGGRDDYPAGDSGSGSGEGGGQQIRDPGGPFMPPGEIGPPPMTRKDRKAAALEQARARQAERQRQREQERGEQGRDR
ncbi:Uncharacterised protein [Mycobacteroides abscessus subsp. massiliense]|uniref:relaxase/mobilization nuclease domain-containing protein n=1 Tax=Mycobacteroides abscessus TaxID=36809 RepID=UPI0009A78B89|nr:hypothetical protein [Mycobacteroides abscessus]SKS82614.1 Uncharacterised protein [Mycobacteroides abscessus subsp. massiliense]SKW11562.1 Uncharacterised protein [Mycobacteroides abscessus subsp. massiliense]SKW46729.1 Uncharacterised protein [Mycobacteroides abscessus subsp. massiliense]